MISRATRYLDRRPLLAVALGMLVAFLIVYVAAPELVEHVDASQPSHSRGTA